MQLDLLENVMILKLLGFFGAEGKGLCYAFFGV